MFIFGVRAVYSNINLLKQLFDLKMTLSWYFDWVFLATQYGMYLLIV